VALNDAAQPPIEERLAALKLRVVVLQAFVGTLLRAVEERLEVPITMGGDDEEDDPLCT
jgi:hypothetical protein